MNLAIIAILMQPVAVDAAATVAIPATVDATVEAPSTTDVEDSAKDASDAITAAIDAPSAATILTAAVQLLSFLMLIFVAHWQHKVPEEHRATIMGIAVVFAGVLGMAADIASGVGLGTPMYGGAMALYGLSATISRKALT